MSDPIANLDTVSLNGRSKRAPLRLNPVSLAFSPGITALLGPSGSGKTSLLNILARFETPDSGAVSLPPTIGWAPADGALWPHLSAGQHITSACPPEAESLPATLLDHFALNHCAGSKPGQLSEGERDRLSIARAIANTHHSEGDPLLVLDEPLAHVEPARKRAYWEAIHSHASGAIVFSTHDPEDAIAEADRVICLDSGSVLFDGDPDSLYHHPPTPKLAAYLGPANWFASNADWARWIDSSPPSAPPICLRPEQLRIREDPNSAVMIDAVQFRGPYEELTVSTNGSGGATSRSLFHRPPRPALKQGTHISLGMLGILTLFLTTAFLLTGCGGQSNEPTKLPVASTKTWQIPPHGPTLPAPRSLTCNRANEVIVLDNAGRILVMSPEGKTLRHWPMPESDVGKPEGVTVLEDGRIVVCDTHYHRLVYFKPDGGVDKMVGEKGEGAGQFIYPVGIDQDDTGNLYVGEYGGNDRIQKFTKEGKWLLSFGGFGVGDGEFQRPSGIVWREGSVYVADAFNNRIQQFNDDGTFVSVLSGKDGASPPRLNFPYDMVWTGGGLMVVEYGAGRLTHLTTEGTVLGTFGQTGSAPGEFATPWGITADSEGRLRVADTGNRRVVSLILTKP